MRKRLNALWILAALLCATLVASLLMGTPRVDKALPLPTELPERVGAWLGHVPRFCQRESCMAPISYHVGNDIPIVCPECDGPLGLTSLPEVRILPEGTRIEKMTYSLGSDRIFVSVVFTGHDRSGIHRPEWCIPSQGLSIRNSRVVSLSTVAEHHLPLRVLDVTSKGGGSGGLFAYWFADVEHETATHWKRLYWMAHNDLFLGVRRPWAYVSLWMPSRLDEKASRALFEFVKAFHLEMHTPLPEIDQGP
jgi:hypothetical protein